MKSYAVTETIVLVQLVHPRIFKEISSVQQYKNMSYE